MIFDYKRSSFDTLKKYKRFSLNAYKTGTKNTITIRAYIICQKNMTFFIKLLFLAVTVNSKIIHYVKCSICF